MSPNNMFYSKKRRVESYKQTRTTLLNSLIQNSPCGGGGDLKENKVNLIENVPWLVEGVGVGVWMDTW